MSPFATSIGMAVLLAVGCLGYQILAYCLPGPRLSKLSTLWILGPGLSIGLLFLFALRAVTSKHVFVPLALVVCVGCASFLVLKFQRLLQSLKSISTVNGWQELLTVTSTMIFLVGIPLARVWPWVLPITFAAAIFVLIFRTPIDDVRWLPLVGSLLFPVLIGIAVASRQLRSELWWMGSDDNQLFEALSHSLVEWGPQEQVIAIAGSGLPHLAYHHLVYFLSGLVNYFVNGETYLVLTRFTPVLVSTCFVASLVLVLFDLSDTMPTSRSLPATRLTFAASYVLLLSVPAPLSNFLGLAALVSSLLIVRRVIDSQSFLRVFVIVFLTLGAIIFSKAPYLYAGVGVFLVISVFGQSKSWRTIGSVLVSTSILLLLFLQTPASSDYHLSFFDFNSIGELSGGRSQVLGVVSVFAPLAIGFSAGVMIMTQGSNSWLRFFTLSSFGVLTAGLFFRLAVGGRIESIRYLWEPAVLFASLLVAAWFIMSTSQVTRREVTITSGLAAIIALIWFSLVPLLVPNLNSGSIVAKFLRLVRDPNFAQFLHFLLIVSVFRITRVYSSVSKRFRLSINIRRQHTWATAIFPIAVGVALAAFIPGVVESVKGARSGIQDAQRQTYIGDPYTAEVAQAIATVARSTEVIAVSLSGCEVKQEVCSTDYSLAAYSKRRFLNLGGFIMYWDRSEQEIADYFLSARIGAEPLGETLLKLQQRGVGFVVIDKHLVERPWELRGSQAGLKERFQNQRYVLFQLTLPESR